MEEEIDLRAYVDVVLRHWYWIVGLALIAAVAAFAASTMKPPIYEASSVVIVAQPRYQLQFDPRFETAEQPKPAYKAFPSLATSDEVLQAVVDAYTPSPEAGIESWRRGVLSDMVSASSEGDPSLVVLSVRSRSPKDAAAIANLWTDTLVKQANAIYGESQQGVTFFEEQLAEAARALGEADTTVVEFEAINNASNVAAHLESLRQAQTDYLGHRRNISYVIQDVRGLRNQLAKQPDDQSLTLADSLTALLLQIKAFSSQATVREVLGSNSNPTGSPALAPGSVGPIELQISSSESLSSLTRSEQIAFLDSLIVTLEEKSAEFESQLTELQPQILELQEKHQEMIVQQERLLGAQELANETYLTLGRKLDEARIASQEEKGTLQIGSYASVPEGPSASNRLSNAFLAGLLGATIGGVIAFGIEFLRHTRTRKQATEE